AETRRDVLSNLPLPDSTLRSCCNVACIRISHVAAQTSKVRRTDHSELCDPLCSCAFCDRILARRRPRQPAWPFNITVHCCHHLRRLDRPFPHQVPGATGGGGGEFRH